MEIYKSSEDDSETHAGSLEFTITPTGNKFPMKNPDIIATSLKY